MYECVFVNVCGNGINTLGKPFSTHHNVNEAFLCTMNYNKRECSCRVEVRELEKVNQDK